MHPLLTSTIRAYPVFLGLAPLTAGLVVTIVLRTTGMPARRMLALIAWLAVGGIGGAKLWSVLERGALAFPLGAELLDGYRQPGAWIGLAGALALCRPRWTGFQRRALADAVALAACFGIVMFRIGCFLNGCCTGIPGSLPWCLRYPMYSSVWANHVVAGLIGSDAPMSLPVHPLPLYFAALALALGCVLLRLWPRRAWDGQLAVVFLAVDGIGKFLLEFLRASPAPVVQAASLVSGVAGLAVLAAVGSVAERVASRDPGERAALAG